MRASGKLTACASLDVPLLPTRDTRPVPSDIPTLVLAVELGPITPLEEAESAVRTLTKGQLVTLPGFAHVAMFQPASELIAGRSP